MTKNPLLGMWDELNKTALAYSAGAGIDAIQLSVRLTGRGSRVRRKRPVRSGGRACRALKGKAKNWPEVLGVRREHPGRAEGGVRGAATLSGWPVFWDLENPGLLR